MPPVQNVLSQPLVHKTRNKISLETKAPHSLSILHTNSQVNPPKPTSVFEVFLGEAKLEQDLQTARARALQGYGRKKSTAVSIIEIELKQLWMNCNPQLCEMEKKACRLSSNICQELKLKDMINNVQ